MKTKTSIPFNVIKAYWRPRVCRATRCAPRGEVSRGERSFWAAVWSGQRGVHCLVLLRVRFSILFPPPGPPHSGRAPCFPREAEERGKLASGGKGWEDTMVLTEHRTSVSELHAAQRRQSSRRRRTRPKRGGPAGRGGAAEPGRRSAELAAEIKKGSRAISNSRNLKRGWRSWRSNTSFKEAWAGVLTLSL